MTTLYKYAIYCNTCISWQTIWNSDEEIPTHCPCNNTHDINLDSINIIDQISENNFSIKEESIPTGGHFSSRTLKINATKNTTTSGSIDWDFPISVLIAKVNSRADHEGDLLNIIVGKNTIIGTITSNIDVGTTVLPVSQSVLDNCFIGAYILLDDTTKTNDCAYIISKDLNNHTITIKTPITSSFLGGTLVKISVYHIKDWEIGVPGSYSIGDGKIGGSYVPKNIPVTVEYVNNSATTDKLFIGVVEYLY